MTIRLRQVRGIIAGSAIAINSFPGTVEGSSRLFVVHTGIYRVGYDTRKPRTQEEESKAITDRYGTSQSV
ncbi:hypothetical protein ALC53_07370 [Atta colombica]|uniref:Uncharacterized protein n=1 Tax=Atta colombica TaxID=520822 RepID=A0A195BD35_9HYME|nr:hypothetical protein ALC53_07370 [Atta colombica]